MELTNFWCGYKRVTFEHETEANDLSKHYFIDRVEGQSQRCLMIMEGGEVILREHYTSEQEARAAAMGQAGCELDWSEKYWPQIQTGPDEWERLNLPVVSVKKTGGMIANHMTFGIHPYFSLKPHEDLLTCKVLVSETIELMYKLKMPWDNWDSAYLKALRSSRYKQVVSTVLEFSEIRASELG